MSIHPSTRTLGRYADGELDPAKRSRVADHLAGCARCRKAVQSRRSVATLLRDEPVPPLPADSFERIVARRAAGDRVILPVAEPAAPPRRWRRLPALAAGVALLLGGALFSLRAPELEAEASELVILPRAPRAGQTVELEYRATGKLADAGRLVLRARLFTAADPMSARHAVVGTLRPAGGRSFRGSFRLPDSVVYAALAVEDSAGERVDYHPAAWEVVAHGPDGRPRLAALESKAAYRQEWDTGLALETAREMTELYPDSASGWFRLYTGQRERADRAGGDSLRTVFLRRLRVLEQAAARTPRPTADELSQLAFFASALDDSVAWNHWRGRVVREHPTHRAGVQLRVFQLVDRHRGDRAAFFAAMDSLWAEVGPISAQLPFTAFLSAQRAGSVEMLRLWGERVAQVEPASAPWVARVFSETPALRRESLQRLRREIRRLDADDDAVRPLGHSADEHRRTRQAGRGFFLGQLGRALIGEGQPRAGLDTLARAVEAGWNVELFRAIADTKLALGDTAGALPVLARVAADPGTRPAFADSARTRLGRRFDAGRWAAGVADGRREMLTHVWSQATDRALRGPVRLTALAGGAETFRAESAGPTFVAFWSRSCPPSLMELGELDRLAAELRERGVRVVAITHGDEAEGAADFLKQHGYTFPVFFDTERDAQRAFDNRATPRYFVLDGAGRIRFGSYSMDDVLRQVTALREEAPRGR